MKKVQKQMDYKMGLVAKSRVTSETGERYRDRGKKPERIKPDREKPEVRVKEESRARLQNWPAKGGRVCEAGPQR